MNHARALDPETNYLPHREEAPAPADASRGSWVQFRLNAEEDDIEITQAKCELRQQGYESGDAFCSHESLRQFNQGFVAPVPYNRPCTEWVHVQHTGGNCIPVLYAWNAQAGLFEWSKCGPLLNGLPEKSIGEGAIARHGDEWLLAARVVGKIYGNIWYRTQDLFQDKPSPVFSDAIGSNCPRTLYRFPDGVIRVMTTDQRNSPYQEINQRRIPLNIMDIDPDGDFAVSRTDVIFDSLKEGLPIPAKHAPTMHFARLLPHCGGNKGFISFFVRTRAIKPRAYTIGNFKGIVQPDEIEASGVYYSEVTYDRDYPPTWDFGG